MARFTFLNLMLAGLLAAGVGCGSKPDDQTYKQFKPSEAKPLADDHGHGQEGPHGGQIVELGDEEFHAEVVLDEPKNEIAIFILGSDAKTLKPIDAKELTLAFQHGDKLEEFKLTASKQESDPEGQSSVFKLTSEDAMGELHEHGEDGAKLNFTVGDKKLSAVIKHSHH